MAYSPQFNLLLVLWLGENDTKRGNSRFIKSCLGQLYLLLCLTGDLSENWAHIGTFGTNVSGPIFDTLGYKISPFLMTSLNVATLKLTVVGEPWWSSMNIE